MLCSYAKYESISHDHRNIISERGYDSVNQLFYSTSLLKKIYRQLTFKKYQGWRTYWRSKSKEGDELFIKVYFGHDDNEINLLNGYKEQHLTVFFNDIFKSIENVSTPAIHDQWINNHAYFIAFKWENLSTIDMEYIRKDTKLLNTLKIILNKLYDLPPPSWWDIKYETHNFANSDYQGNFDNSSPFDIDFLQNIAMDGRGQLYFFDYEKYQWTRKGLQEIYLALYLFLMDLRINDKTKDYIYDVFLSHINMQERKKIIKHAINLLNNRLISIGQLPITNDEEKNISIYLLKR